MKTYTTFMSPTDTAVTSLVDQIVSLVHPLKEDWLRRAHSDLALACGRLRRSVLPEDLCFHAQQAVEKSLKAVRA